MGDHGQSLGFALIMKQKEGSARRAKPTGAASHSTWMQQSNCPATSAARLQHEEDVTFVVLFLCFVTRPPSPGSSAGSEVQMIM